MVRACPTLCAGMIIKYVTSSGTVEKCVLQSLVASRPDGVLSNGKPNPWEEWEAMNIKTHRVCRRPIDESDIFVPPVVKPGDMFIPDWGEA